MKTSMDDSEDVLFQDFLYKLKTSKGGRFGRLIHEPWSSKYFVLCRQHDKLLLRYYNKKPKHAGRAHPKRQITLWPSFKVEKISNMHNRAFGLELTATDRQLCLSADEQSTVDLLVFLLQTQIRLRDNIRDDLVTVTTEPSEACRRIGAKGAKCVLHVSPWGLTLALQRSRTVLAQWPLKSIKYYESSGQGQFTIEAGKVAPMGEGVFTFHTAPGLDNRLYDVVDQYVVNTLDRVKPNQRGTAEEIEDYIREFDCLHSMTELVSARITNTEMARLLREIWNYTLPFTDPGDSGSEREIPPHVLAGSSVSLSSQGTNASSSVTQGNSFAASPSSASLLKSDNSSRPLPSPHTTSSQSRHNASSLPSTPSQSHHETAAGNDGRVVGRPPPPRGGPTGTARLAKSSPRTPRSARQDSVDGVVSPHTPRSLRQESVDRGIAPHTPRSLRQESVDASIAPHTPRSSRQDSVDSGMRTPRSARPDVDKSPLSPWVLRQDSVDSGPRTPRSGRLDLVDHGASGSSHGPDAQSRRHSNPANVALRVNHQHSQSDIHPPVRKQVSVDQAGGRSSHTEPLASMANGSVREDLPHVHRHHRLTSDRSSGASSFPGTPESPPPSGFDEASAHTHHVDAQVEDWLVSASCEDLSDHMRTVIFRQRSSRRTAESTMSETTPSKKNNESNNNNDPSFIPPPFTDIAQFRSSVEWDRSNARDRSQSFDANAKNKQVHGDATKSLSASPSIRLIRKLVSARTATKDGGSSNLRKSLSNPNFLNLGSKEQLYQVRVQSNRSSQHAEDTSKLSAQTKQKSRSLASLLPGPLRRYVSKESLSRPRSTSPSPDVHHRRQQSDDSTGSTPTSTLSSNFKRQYSARSLKEMSIKGIHFTEQSRSFRKPKSSPRNVNTDSGATDSSGSVTSPGRTSTSDSQQSNPLSPSYSSNSPPRSLPRSPRTSNTSLVMGSNPSSGFVEPREKTQLPPRVNGVRPLPPEPTLHIFNPNHESGQTTC